MELLVRKSLNRRRIDDLSSDLSLCVQVYHELCRKSLTRTGGGCHQCVVTIGDGLARPFLEVAEFEVAETGEDVVVAFSVELSIFHNNHAVTAFIVVPYFYISLDISLRRDSNGLDN